MNETHVHKWQPNGQIQVQGVTHSPVSRLDDTLYTKVYSSMVCECGKVRNVHVANKILDEEGATSDQQDQTGQATPVAHDGAVDATSDGSPENGTGRDD